MCIRAKCICVHLRASLGPPSFFKWISPPFLVNSQVDTKIGQRPFLLFQEVWSWEKTISNRLIYRPWKKLMTNWFAAMLTFRIKLIMIQCSFVNSFIHFFKQCQDDVTRSKMFCIRGRVDICQKSLNHCNFWGNEFLHNTSVNNDIITYSSNSTNRIDRR